MRVKIIAYDAIIIFCHLIEVAIFAISNFFSLFGIAIFNIPISHIIVFLLFLMQSYCFFRYLQTFFNFFSFFAFRSPKNHKFCLYALPESSLFLWSCVPLVCRSRSCPVSLNHTHAHTYARIYVRARGFLDSNF